MEETSMQIIGHVHTDFPTKFGLPRQSGLIEELVGRIELEPEFRRAEAFRGIEEFSHLWILWQFSLSQKEHWSATVKPPRLGGKKRMGVFATRSPFRPNAIGLSSVRLDRAALQTPDGPVLHISGADLMDGTPILDIKPYLAYTDAHPEAAGGFALQSRKGVLRVCCPAPLLARLPADRQEALRAVLAHDPRPGYQHLPGRVYGFPFAGFEVRFTVDGDTLTVVAIEPID